MSSNCIRCSVMRLNDKELDLSVPQVMAIVNITPASFFEKSRVVDDEAIEARIRQVVAEGASIIDIGGYSSRPGACDVAADEEWERVRRALIVVRRVAEDVPVSVDTFRASVAERAIEEFGAVIINDISAGEADPSMWDVVARYDVPYVAMHMRGRPETMQSCTDYDNVTRDVVEYLATRAEQLKRRGVECVVLDPGFGFAKTLSQNYELLHGLSDLVAVGCPVLVGISRKSMIYKALDISQQEALTGTIALHWECLRAGARILRVHDTREAVQTIKLFETYESYR